MGTSSRSLKETGFARNCYNTCVEIFLALSDFEHTYRLDHRKKLRVCDKDKSRFVTVYFKPPGALKYIEYFRTEVIVGSSNPVFSNKLHLHFNRDDVAAVSLLLEVSYWGAAEVFLEKLLIAGGKGLDISLPLSLDPADDEVEFLCSTIIPARLFVRAEVIHPSYNQLEASVGLQLKSSILHRNPSFVLEISRMNEESLSELATPYPYTLIIRKKLNENDKHRRITRDKSDSYWAHVSLSVAELCNGDLDRTLKMEVHKSSSRQRDHCPHFVVTTWRKILDAEEKLLAFPLSKPCGKKCKRMQLVIKSVQINPLYNIDRHLPKGLSFQILYAIADNIGIGSFGESSFNQQQNSCEEALTLTGKTMKGLCGTKSFVVTSEFSSGQGLGREIPEHGSGHIRALVGSFRKKMKVLECEPETKMIQNGKKVAPVLKCVCEAIKEKSDSKYFCTFVFASDYIMDYDECATILMTLSSFPMSVIFVGIGEGESNRLDMMVEAFRNLAFGTPLWRNCVHVVHFQSLLHWDKSVKFGGYQSSPYRIFQNECFSAVRNHCLEYLQLYGLDSI